MDTIDLNEIEIRQKIKTEVEKIKKFQRLVLGSSEKIEIKDIDIRNYSKFILQEGSIEEKREFLRYLKSRVTLASKNVSLL